MIPTWFEQFFNVLFAPAAIAAGVYWLVRSFINSKFDEWTAEAEGRIQKELHKYETKFSYLHQKRAEVIEETYHRLVNSYDRLSELTSPGQMRGENTPSAAERRKAAAEAYQELDTYYRKHRIYFSEELCGKIESVLNHMFDSFNKFQVSDASDEYQHDESGLWREAWNTLQENVPPLKRELEREFRSALQAEEDTIG